MGKKSERAEIIRLLNEVLTGELTAINQYFIHAKMCENWGYRRLHSIIRKESIEEMVHAEELMERVLFLGGVPNVQRLGKVNVGETVKEQLTLDRAVEAEAIPRLNEAIAVCRDAGDNGSRMLLEKILHDEEEHIDWIDAQLTLIEQVGLENWLTQQIHD
ncbi:MAG: bacterioferritin [Deltaproteobacteria bacterium]|nr:bacterioferritin [Deltaproteobacteria bacterium]MCB9788036.1 bacterioferritin [Deltaproteobacteria bacterium]